MLKVGLQLYSVRGHMAGDPMGTLERVAQIGYRILEAGNHNADQDDGIGFGVPAGKLCDLLGRMGLSVISTHVMPLREERLDAIAEYQRAIGAQYVVGQMEFFKSPQHVLDYAAQLNRTGEALRKRGLRFLYHNHFHEYQSFTGETVWETLLAHTDPELVGFQLDTFWAYRGGADAAALIRRHASRIPLLHQKDFAADAGEPLNLLAAWPQGQWVDGPSFGAAIRPGTFCEVGEGTLPIQGVIDAANEGGKTTHIILEQDFSRKDELESIALSMKAFRKYRGVEWA